MYGTHEAKLKKLLEIKDFPLTASFFCKEEHAELNSLEIKSTADIKQKSWIKLVMMGYICSAVMMGHMTDHICRAVMMDIHAGQS